MLQVLSLQAVLGYATGNSEPAGDQAAAGEDQQQEQPTAHAAEDAGQRVVSPDGHLPFGAQVRLLPCGVVPATSACADECGGWHQRTAERGGSSLTCTPRLYCQVCCNVTSLTHCASRWSRAHRWHPRQANLRASSWRSSRVIRALRLRRHPRRRRAKSGG